MIRLKWLIFAFAVFALQTSAYAADETWMNNWPQWRGPLATGAAPNAQPPLKWDAQTNVKWKAEVPGEGSSSPVVWGDKVFVTSAIETDRVKEDAQAGGGAPTHYFKFDVFCFNRDSGDLIWRKTAVEEVPHEGHQANGSYASGSPIVDGEHLYVPFGSRGYYCYTLDGDLVWKRDLGDMQTRNAFGEGSSPALHGDSLVINWDHEGPSFITCLDAKTGEPRWKVDRDEKTTWDTPLIVEHGGVTQVIVNGQNRARSYDLKDGSLLWECGGQTANPIPSSMSDGTLAFCLSGFRGAALYAIPLDARGDLTGTDKIAWKIERDTPYVPSGLLVDGKIYFTKGNSPILTCVKASDGSHVIEATRLQELLGELYSSPVAGGGRIYITSRSGETLVLEQGDSIKTLAVNKLDEDVDSSLALVGKQIFIRAKHNLYCIEDAG
ncbi:MAG: PQQ-binding-like beta-propeller repeat protein [bacterium]|nr:PQQ-binding-like beta-propeller repeat protein [bacterium]